MRLGVRCPSWLSHLNQDYVSVTILSLPWRNLALR